MCFHFPSSKACSVQMGQLFLLCLDCALTRRSLSRVVLAHFLGSRPSVIVTGMVRAFPFPVSLHGGRCPFLVIRERLSSRPETLQPPDCPEL